MVAELSNNGSDFSEMTIRLASLKIDEADLLREAAEIERKLAAKKCEVMEIRRQIEQLTQKLGHDIGDNPMVGNADLGHNPEEQPSLLALIEKLLLESKDGLTLAELVLKIRESGHISRSTKPRSMVDQAIFRLKKKELIVRNPESLKFSLKATKAEWIKAVR